MQFRVDMFKISYYHTCILLDFILSGFKIVFLMYFSWTEKMCTSPKNTR